MCPHQRVRPQERVLRERLELRQCMQDSEKLKNNLETWNLIWNLNSEDMNNSIDENLELWASWVLHHDAVDKSVNHKNNCCKFYPSVKTIKSWLATTLSFYDFTARRQKKSSRRIDRLKREPKSPPAMPTFVSHVALTIWRRCTVSINRSNWVKLGWVKAS